MATLDPINALPSLDSEGWVTNIDQLIDRVLSYTFLSDASQSTMFKGYITSVQAIIQKNGDDALGLQEDMRMGLDNTFRRWFDKIEIDVRVQDVVPGSAQLNIEIYLEVSYRGESRKVASVAEFYNGIFRRIVDINEGRA